MTGSPSIFDVVAIGASLVDMFRTRRICRLQKGAVYTRRSVVLYAAGGKQTIVRGVILRGPWHCEVGVDRKGL